MLISIIFMILVLTVGAAFASGWGNHHRHYRYHGYSSFGIFIGPPVIWAPPIYHQYYYPPPVYEGPSYYDRAWVPGHWEERYGPYGWERVWVPGYWRY